MKKMLLVAVAAMLLLTSCSTQSQVNPDLFIRRFSQTYSEFAVETEQMFYEEGKCVVFINNSSDTRFAAEMSVDEADRVQKISLACTDADKAEEFRYFAECVSRLYAPQEVFNAVSQNLFGGKKYAYRETQWYYYCFSQTETGLFFSIENKRIAPAKEERLTLKENETLIVR